jgi:hypothetical protein
MKNLRNVAVYLTVLTLTTACFLPMCFAVDAAEASGTIGQAEHDLGSALAAVAEAESAEADVSALLNKLESANDFLSEAYAAFRTGDYGNASLFAVNCSHAVEGVADDASRLNANAKTTRSDRLLLTVTESGAGLVLLLVLGLIGWRLLKRRYFRRILDMKPLVETVR